MKEIYIGKKEPGTYITPVDRKLEEDGEAILKARGNSISNAVNVAELCTKRIFSDRGVEIEEINTDTEIMENNEGEEVRVSVIEIRLG